MINTSQSTVLSRDDLSMQSKQIKLSSAERKVKSLDFMILLISNRLLNLNSPPTNRASIAFGDFKEVRSPEERV